MEKNKFFLSIEKEQQWLNEMSAQGYRFTGRIGVTYRFQEAQPGAYHYLVDQRGFQKDNQEFVAFLEEMEIRLVQKYLGFYYFETEETDGREQLYTDWKSRIDFYKRSILALIVLMLFNISIIHGANGPYIFNISIPVVVNSVILFMAALTISRYLKNIQSLEREKE